MNQIQFALFVYGIVFFIVLVIWRSWLTWKNTGNWPVILSSSHSLRGFALAGLKVIALLTILASVLYCSSSALYIYLIPIRYLEAFRVQMGFTLLTVSIVWIGIAQANMQNSFRIGIDEKVPTALIISGLFRFSRNPIYLGMITSITGFFLVIPSALTFATLTLSYVFIEVEIRLEEEFLLEAHGDSFRSYCQNVRRWL